MILIKYISLLTCIPRLVYQILNVLTHLKIVQHGSQREGNIHLQNPICQVLCQIVWVYNWVDDLIVLLG